MTRIVALGAVIATVLAAGPALSAPSCLKAQTMVDEAVALRHQARQEARFGSHDHVCDTLDEVGDRCNDARDAFHDFGAGVIAIDLRGELRALRIPKHVNRCE